MANNLHMGGRQLQVERAKLQDEKTVLRELKETYTRAGKDVAEKIRIQNGRINVLLKDIDNLDDTARSILQSAIYQRDFQNGLKRQIDAYMDVLNDSNSKTLNEYLANCYKNGFIGSVFDMQGQGVPLAMPIDPKKLAKASVLTPKLSRKLYGQYAGDVKQAARNEISRGIATASSYAEIARNINAQVQVGYNKAARIARTEGHRIQAESAFDAQLAARDAGADVVKQWDAALDGRTRDTHMKLDGQIKELDEPFEVDGMTAMYPSDFGDPAEDINCRCALTQRARWALDDDETKHLQNVENMSEERKKMIADKLGITPDELEKYSGQTIPINAKNYADFRKQYNKIWNYDKVDPLRGRAATAANAEGAAQIKVARQATTSGVNGGTIASDESIFDGIVKLQAGMTQDYNDVLNNKFANGSLAAKKAFNKYVAHDSVIDPAYAGVAHFNRSDGRIRLNYASDLTNRKGAGTTYFHEHGHYIDFMAAGSSNANYLSTNSPTFGALLRSDFKDYVNGYKKQHGLKAAGAYNQISWDLMGDDKHSLSDLIDGISKGKASGWYGHKRSYWNNAGALEREAFAHMFEASFDKNKYKLMKQYFPNALAEFEKMIKAV